MSQIGLIEFVRSLPSKPWVVVGKGPTCDRVYTLPRNTAHIFSLNQACVMSRPTIAHFADVEPIRDMHDFLLAYQTMAEYPSDPEDRFRIVTPWQPHVNMKPTEKTATELIEKDLHASLLCYNAPSAVRHKFKLRKDLPNVEIRYFSAEAAFSILGQAGVKTIFTAGVDGGTRYGRGFDEKDRLKNGRSSFDRQFPEIDRICKKYGITRQVLRVQ